MAIFRFLITGFAILLLLIVGLHAAQKLSKKEALPQRATSPIHRLDQDVDAWTTETEKAGHRTREEAAHDLNRWERQWRDFRHQTLAIWKRTQQGYYDARRFFRTEVAEIRSMIHQVQSLLHSK